jgi:hypothetical protein
MGSIPTFAQTWTGDRTYIRGVLTPHTSSHTLVAEVIVMSEERSGYGTKPAQFRLPLWAHEFLVHESSELQITKTDVVLRALEGYKRQRFEELLGQEYSEMAAEDRAHLQVWDASMMDGLEPGEW